MSLRALAAAALGVLLALLLAAALAAAAPAEAGRRVPAGFVGTNIDGPLMKDSELLKSQMKPMLQAGIESIRMTFDWSRIQPYESIEDVPPDFLPYYPLVDGRPTDFRATDERVRRAAKRGMSVMPVLLYAPRWAAQHPGRRSSPPRDPDDFAHFAVTMVHRYGSHGTFWNQNPDVPRLPIRDWQIWNEPHFNGFWDDSPWAPGYVKLLKRTYRQIHAADVDPRVVLAGLSNDSWNYLRDIYRAGGRGHFDLAAIHPYTQKVGGVVTILERARRVMKNRDDGGRPLLVTELSWPSARGKTEKTYGIVQTEKGQAKQLSNAYELLADERKRLKLRAAYWYTWLSKDRSDMQPFDYAGVMKLRGGEGVKKPAYRALREVAAKLEGR
jgi:hypothetical protein